MDIGGILIPIGYDLPALQAQTGRLKGILADLEKPREIKLRADAGNLQAVAKNSKQQIIEIYEVVEKGAYKLKAPDDSQFKTWIAQFRDGAEEEGEQIGRKLGRGIDKGLSHAGGVAGAHGDLSRKNLLSRRGLESLGLGGSATAAFAIIEAAQIGSELLKVGVESQRAQDRILRDANAVGSGFDPTRNAKSVEAAKTIAEAETSEKVMGAFESVPIVGILAKFATPWAHAQNEENVAEAKRSMQLQQMLYAVGQQQQVESAQLTGNTPEEIRAADEHARAGLEKEAARTTIHSKTHWWETDHPYEIGSVDESGRYISGSGSSEAQLKIEEQRRLDSAKEEIAKNQYEGQIARTVSSIEASRTTAAASEKQAEATSVLAAGGAGAQSRAIAISRDALVKRQAAEATRIYRDIQADVAAAAPTESMTSAERKNAERKASLIQSKGDADLEEAKQRDIAAMAALDKQETDFAKDQEISRVRNAGQATATLLSANRQYWASRLEQIKSASRAEIMEAEKTGQSVLAIEAIKARQMAQYQGAVIEHEREIGLSVRSSAAATTAASLRGVGTMLGAVGRTDESMAAQYQARIATRTDEQAQILEKLYADSQRTIGGVGGLGGITVRDLRQYDAKRQEFDAQNRAEDIDQQAKMYQHRLAVGGQLIQIGANTRAYELETENKPIAAGIERLRAQAELAVRNATPETIAAIRGEEHAMVEAKRHELFGIHSGGYAASENAYFSSYNALDQSVRRRDLEEAKKNLDETEQVIDKKAPGEILNWLISGGFQKAMEGALAGLGIGLVH
jgi:hypothetical protein